MPSGQNQQRRTAEIVAQEAPQPTCPGSGTRCELVPQKRQVESVDGEVELHELVACCSRCRRSLFPSA